MHFLEFEAVKDIILMLHEVKGFKKNQGFETILKFNSTAYIGKVIIRENHFWCLLHLIYVSIFLISFAH